MKVNYRLLLGSLQFFSKMHEAPRGQSILINPSFTLRKNKGDILFDKLDTLIPFDLIYYDAFAPAKQPEMWTIDILKNVTDSLASGGIWITYCAKGQVKRDLASLGLTVETLAGPPAKKEV